MWGELCDDRGHMLDDLLIEADRNAVMFEADEASFWDGYREDGLPYEEELTPLDELEWAA